MPQGNRRGPDGMGPMTGRGMGYCTGHDGPGYMYSPNNMHQMYQMHRGRAFGGRGGGMRGMRRGFPGSFDMDYGYAGRAPRNLSGDEVEMLKDDLEYLRTQMSDTETRIQELEISTSGEASEDTTS